MSTPDSAAYGLLLALDGYGADVRDCADGAKLRNLLQTLPPSIGMRPLGEPHTVYVDEEGIRGLSGFTFIMESHISIHTYEERGFVTADIYSCKLFDTQTAAEYITQAFGLTNVETQVITRGRGFHNLPLPTPEPQLRR
ncbi:MAG TPA: S-adenosylmethionine decarboxylase [Candidatus Paceibacterota bacterium]|jgi:S-adenosylmethionine decarboxylase